MTAIRVQGLYHQYSAQDRPSVDNVSFEVADGEFYTLLGPSGCGKTTTLRCVAGLEDPLSGLIELDGQTVVSDKYRIPANKRDIGLVFQDYAVWPHMTVFENVAYPLRVGRRVPRSSIRPRVEEALSTVGLDQFTSRRATQLSGGQQQRLSLARALVRQPKVLLLDEPLSNLDASLREQMRTELRGIQRRLKIATLFVTHDQVEALSMSNRIAVMRNGCIVQEGTPREIYQTPNSEFVARFVGLATFLPGTVVEQDFDTTAAVQTSMGTLQISTHRTVQMGEAVTVVVRPEDVVVYPHRDRSDGVNTFDGEIQAAYFVGDAVHFRVRLGDEVIRATGPGRVRLRRGDRVHVTLPPEACTLLRDGQETRALGEAASV
jgi:iron(III) transport system ATP-binding protein